MLRVLVPCWTATEQPPMSGTEFWGPMEPGCHRAGLGSPVHCWNTEAGSASLLLNDCYILWVFFILHKYSTVLLAVHWIWKIYCLHCLCWIFMLQLDISFLFSFFFFTPCLPRVLSCAWYGWIHTDMQSHMSSRHAYSDRQWVGNPTAQLHYLFH